MADSPTDLGALLELALSVAGEAGALLRERRGNASAGVLTKSSSTDMVTDADRASEALIVHRLREARPDDGIIGEEGANLSGSSGISWLVDPLDGTTNFLYDYSPFAVSIAARRHGEGLVGVVHDVASGETFSAARGAGAFLDGRPIAVSSKRELATALIGTGFGYDPEVRRAQAELLVRVLPVVRDVRRAGAASVDLCWVACGRLDGYYERGLRPWDLAAGELIVREAGGRSAELNGDAGSTIAAGPRIFEGLRELVEG